MQNVKTYTLREEKANYLTHALGALVALVATLSLVSRAVYSGNKWAVVAFFIYGGGMLACMLSSSVYHYVQEPKLKAKLRHWDHANIYVLIAASFSPVTLILLRNVDFWGWGLFALVWVSAAVGIALNFGEIKANNNLKTASYVLMGLSSFIAIKPMVDAAKQAHCLPVLYWLAVGGVFYIAGSVIYALAKREFVHTVFHVFVLFGLAAHIVSAFYIPL